MSTVELNVKGMSCGSCVLHVTEALNAVEGVPVCGSAESATAMCLSPLWVMLDTPLN